MLKTIQDKAYHCGLDDTIDALEELVQKSPGSIFDTEVFTLLKDWHTTHGTTFTLYLFYEKKNGFNLSQMPDKYKSEWQANADWLRLTFHARTKTGHHPDYYYAKTDYQTAKDDYRLIKKEIERFAGLEVWDNYVRTHYWSGSREAVRAWRDCGVSALFYSYPGYNTLYFNEEQSKELQQKDFRIEPEFNLLLITTNVMLPGHTVEQVKNRLQELGQKNTQILDIFCDDYNVIQLKEQVQTVIDYASAHNYKPVFYDEVFK